MKNKMLSQSVTDNIMTMITVEKRFSVGDKLLNELELAEELNVSRQLYGKRVEEGIRQNRDRTFQSCQRNVPMQDTMEEYVALTKKTEENQKAYFTGPMGNDIYQFSSFP